MQKMPAGAVLNGVVQADCTTNWAMKNWTASIQMMASRPIAGAMSGDREEASLFIMSRLVDSAFQPRSSPCEFYNTNCNRKGPATDFTGQASTALSVDSSAAAVAVVRWVTLPAPRE